MKQFRKTKNRKMKSVEIELSEWVKFNERQEKIPVQEKKELVKREKGKPGIARKELAGGSGRYTDPQTVEPSSSKGMTKRERKRAKEEEERAAQIAQEYLEESLRRDHAWETKKDYVLSRKERMESLTQEMEQLKREYRVLAEYHNDIDLLQNLPDEGTKKIRDTASVILRLQKDRKSFQEDNTLLDDGKYMQMSQYTEDMPDVIRRLTADEMYVSKLKTEIDQLEGEKSEQQFEGRDVEENQGKMKKIAIACMFSLLALFAVFIVLQLEFEADTQIVVLLCGIAFAALTLAVFIRYFNNVNRAKTAEHKLNKIIVKQNKVKMKYVNAKNGVDYVYRKYQVHSASELLFQWEQFIMTKNARENYQRSGNELSYYEDRLQRQLGQYRIQDPGIWMNQIEYLADEKEMEKLKAELGGKVEEARQKIDNCHSAIQKAKDDVSLLAIKNPEYAQAIRQLMDQGEDPEIEIE